MTRKKIVAYKDGATGLYRLIGKTYHKRERLKAAGAQWVPEGKYWLASREAAEDVNAHFMMRARVAAHCHEEERVIGVSHHEVKRGWVILGCGLCDKSSRCGDRVEILEVLGEIVMGNNEAEQK